MNPSWTRSELKDRAKAGVKRNYWAVVAASLVMAFVTWLQGSNAGASQAASQAQDYVGAQESFFHIFTQNPLTMLLAAIGTSVVAVLGIVFVVAKIFIGSLLEVGVRKFYIENLSDTPGAVRILYGFQCGQYWNIVKTMFLRDLFIVLWSLLLVIPGVVKSYEYRLVPYLLAEYPDMPWREAFQRSRDMMYGQKGNAFVLDLSFIPWKILSSATLHIAGVFYVNPYIDATDAELYDALAGGGTGSAYTQNNW